MSQAHPQKASAKSPPVISIQNICWGVPGKVANSWNCIPWNCIPLCLSHAQLATMKVEMYDTGTHGCRFRREIPTANKRTAQFWPRYGSERVDLFPPSISTSRRKLWCVKHVGETHNNRHVDKQARCKAFNAMYKAKKLIMTSTQLLHQIVISKSNCMCIYRTCMLVTLSSILRPKVCKPPFIAGCSTYIVLD